MPFEFRPSDEQKMLVETIRRFMAEEIFPHEHVIERKGEFFPPRTADRLDGSTGADPRAYRAQIGRMWLGSAKFGAKPLAASCCGPMRREERAMPEVRRR